MWGVHVLTHGSIMKTTHYRWLLSLVFHQTFLFSAMRGVFWNRVEIARSKHSSKLSTNCSKQSRDAKNRYFTLIPTRRPKKHLSDLSTKTECDKTKQKTHGCLLCRVLIRMHFGRGQKLPTRWNHRPFGVDLHQDLPQDCIPWGRMNSPISNGTYTRRLFTWPFL